MFEECLVSRPMVQCDYPKNKESFVLSWFPELCLRLEHERAKNLKKASRSKTQRWIGDEIAS